MRKGAVAARNRTSTSMVVLLAASAVCAVTLAAGLSTGCRKPKPVREGPAAVQEPLTGGPYPALVLSQAWFWKNAEGKPRPGPARLLIWRQTPTGWHATRWEDDESNVFHKSIVLDRSILTIGGDAALLKRWTLDGNRLTGQRLWRGFWGGKFNRLRDIEIGDVDGDGKDEYVIATHDAGVVAVLKAADGHGDPRVVELDRKPDTFVHEIEIGDIRGDGKPAFFATPSGRNRGDSSQSGEVVMFQWNSRTYDRTVVDSFAGTHAKEILVTDTDGDGKDELYVVVEGEVKDGERLRPVEIRRYQVKPGGHFGHQVIATVEDSQARCLLAADFDGDGSKELVLTAMRSGTYLLKRQPRNSGSSAWKVSLIDASSSGFEHAAVAADLDGDGTPELYVAADDQAELSSYRWNRSTSSFDKTRIGPLEKATYTWSIAAGRL